MEDARRKLIAKTFSESVVVIFIKFKRATCDKKRRQLYDVISLIKKKKKSGNFFFVSEGYFVAAFFYYCLNFFMKDFIVLNDDP